MKFLLDTNVILYTISDDPVLPDEAREAINSNKDELFLSVVSIWEIVIKHAKNPSLLPVSGEYVARYCSESGIQFLPVTKEHVLAVSGLKTENSHTDPFDRLLIAQSKCEAMTFMTCDGELEGYHEPTVWSLKKKRKNSRQ